MQADEVRFLYSYDRWATKRVLAMLDDLDPAVWSRPNAVGDMSLGLVMTHQLGAAQRWRNAFQQSSERPEPERESLLSIDELRLRWEQEWRIEDAWLPAITDGFVAHVFEGTPVWMMLVHVINHGTQHRAEASALLTAEGRSPGELDLINFVEERQATPPGN